MVIGSKGKVIEVKDRKAVVEIEGRRKSFPIIENLRVKKGDSVVVVLDRIIGKE